MSKKEQKESKEFLLQIETTLFQIHALAKVMETYARDNSQKPSAINRWSDERITLSQVIVEKAEFCIKMFDEGEVS
jgi:hypothetical protein